MQVEPTRPQPCGKLPRARKQCTHASRNVQAQRDFADFAMIGDAEAQLVDGILTLRIDLRPREARNGGDARD